MNEIKNLCFEGGGVKGVAFCGAIKKLNEANLLNKAERYAGTSAGAIMATLLAIGYSIDEIFNIMEDTDFSSFKDDSIGIFLDFHRVLTDYGFYKGDAFSNWIGKHIKKKLGSSKVTFNALPTDSLYVVATNLTKQKIEIFSKKHTFNVKIKDAVRMSMSIPLFFKSFNYNNDIIVDGGLSYNYPVDIFDTDKPNPETLGFRLDSESEIKAMKAGTKPISEIDNIIDYITAVLEFFMVAANKSHLDKKDKDRTIFINTGEIAATNFNLTRKEIDFLVKQGEKSVTKFIKGVK